MTQHIELNHGNKVHDGFFDAIQELLGASMPSLRIKVLNTTTLQAAAGTGNDQQGVAIGGKYRYITTNVNASLPGGLTNGTGSVYVTAAANDFSGDPGEEDETDYAFALEIRASGTPSAALYRKVGEVDVTAGAIKAFRPMGGPRPTGEFTLVASPDHSSQPSLLVRSVNSQNAALTVQDPGGATAFAVSPSGTVYMTGSLAVDDTFYLLDANENDILVSDADGLMTPQKLTNDQIDDDAGIDTSKLNIVTTLIDVTSLANGDVITTEFNHALGHTNYMVFVSTRKGSPFKGLITNWDRGKLVQPLYSDWIVVSGWNTTGSSWTGKIAVMVVDLT